MITDRTGIARSAVAGGRPEGGKPLLHVLARDGADLLPPEPRKDLVLQVHTIDRKRARLPVSGITAEYNLRDLLERSLCQGFH